MSSQLTSYYLELDKLYLDFELASSEEERNYILDQIDRLDLRIEYCLERERNEPVRRVE